MGRLDDIGVERLGADIADIAVAIELRPAPAVLFLVDEQGFAMERLGVGGGVFVGSAPQIGMGSDDLHAPPRRIGLRLDHVAQMFGREIGPGRR